MYAYPKTAMAQKAAKTLRADSHGRNSPRTALTPVYSDPASAQLRQLQETANTGQYVRGALQLQATADTHSTQQLQTIQRGRGSHNKKKMLNVQGSYTQGGAVTNFNDRAQDISIVKGHGGYEDEDALAEDWVRKAYSLATADTVTITKYNFYTKR